MKCLLYLKNIFINVWQLHYILIRFEGHMLFTDGLSLSNREIKHCEMSTLFETYFYFITFSLVLRASVSDRKTGLSPLPP